MNFKDATKIREEAFLEFVKRNNITEDNVSLARKAFYVGWDECKCMQANIEELRELESDDDGKKSSSYKTLSKKYFEA